MKRYALMENRWGKVLFGVFLFAMLLLARDTLISSCLIGFAKSQFLMLGAICLFALVVFLRNRAVWRELLTDQRILFLVLSVLVMLVPMLGKRDWQLMYFSILICLLLPVLLSYVISWQEVAKYYVMILAALGIYSLVGMYLLKDPIMDGRLSVPIFMNSANMQFANLGLTFVVPWPFWNRNFGIFREPGVYQFFLILGIYLTHYGICWKRNWSMWLMTAVLTVTLITTFAIGGFVELGLFLVFLYFDKRYYQTRAGMVIGAAAVVSLFAVIVHIIAIIRTGYFEMTIYYEFYDMFKRLTTDSDSLVDRFSAIFVSAGLFLHNPLLGDTIANVLHGTAHNTSSTLILYAILGFAGGTLNVAAWIALLWKKERNILGNLLLMMILFMSFNTQNLTANVFFWLFPYMALTEVLVPKLKFPERKI